MNLNLLKQTTIGLTLSLFLTHSISAQNIVTIFGQEKIEKTEEGSVFHHFTDGFLLPGGNNTGVFFNGQDMIGWLYATDNFQTPKDGQKIGFSYPNMEKQIEDEYLTWLARTNGEANMKPMPEWIWTSMQSDSTGLFKRPEMRSAYLYTSYDSPKEEIALLETTGGTRTYVNGFPHEGDHYDFGYTLTPVKLKKGLNEFVYTPGRFGKIESKLVKPKKDIIFTKRDMTLPDIIIGENDAKWAAIRVVNASEKPLKGISIRATLPNGKQEVYQTNDIIPLTTRKLAFKIPSTESNSLLTGNFTEAEAAELASTLKGNVTIKLELLDKAGKVLDETSIDVRQVLPSVHHERTFISNIDGSVQYYSVAPAKRDSTSDKKAMVLTVHGAGVEARNQARAYKSKDWTDIVAATNRRPYGFNWEDWGRMDALEVLEEAQKVFQPIDSTIYLTGHSMGGHGTWYLGTTYPDKFAAIAPCAGYPDIAGYSRGSGDSIHLNNPKYDVFSRSANGGRVKSMAKNLIQSGVYIFHGSDDSVVKPSQARGMRELLGTFHPDFCYYEYPGGEHWFGDESVDWKPIFEFFSRHSIPQDNEVKEIDFYTASPAISAEDYWIRIEQQMKPYEMSNINAIINKDTVEIKNIDNVKFFVLDLPNLKFNSEKVFVKIDNQLFQTSAKQKANLNFKNGRWNTANSVNNKEKNAIRYGGFKNAFDNNVVLVYGTQGNKEEIEWNMNRARFDAETFYYRANGSVDVISDSEYSPSKYTGRNVVLYGNMNNNKLWKTLLKDSPIKVSKNKILFGNKTLEGDDLGVYFIYPNPNDNQTSVGVVAGTGEKGMKATSPNNYISGITGFPDFMIYRADILKDGLEGVEVAGYFGNDWTLTSEDYK